MYEFSNGELEQLLSASREALNDATCLGCWVDSLEYDVREYIGEKPFTAFRGFSQALVNHLNLIRGILFSKEYSLDL